MRVSLARRWLAMSAAWRTAAREFSERSTPTRMLLNIFVSPLRPVPVALPTSTVPRSARPESRRSAVGQRQVGAVVLVVRVAEQVEQARGRGDQEAVGVRGGG